MVHDRRRAAVEVLDERPGVVDPEVVVDRRQEVARAAHAVDRVLAARVGGADEPAGGDPAARREIEELARQVLGDRVPPELVEDIVTYFKSCTLEQIQGGSGYQYMREDLNERVRVRGQGKVRDFVLQSFIVE